MTKRLPPATKCPSFYRYWPNTCVRLSNVLDGSGLMVQQACDFTIICFLARLQNNGERNFVLPFGDWKIDLESQNSVENNDIISFHNRMGERPLSFCPLIRTEDLVSSRMDKTCHSLYLERWHRFGQIFHPGKTTQKILFFSCSNIFLMAGKFREAGSLLADLVANIIWSLNVCVCNGPKCVLFSFNSSSNV